MKYDFDDIADRSIDNARKWDKKIVNKKFPGIADDFIPLWIADMDFKAAPEIRNALTKMSENGAYGYTYPTEKWFQSVIDWQDKKHNNHVEKDWITLGYGTVPNMHYLVQALTEPEDYIIMNTPVYGPFAYAAEHNNRKVITVPLILKGDRYYLDFNKLEDEMKAKHPKILMFCSPHNPSGRIWSQDELIKVAQLCLDNDVVLVSDEVHSEHIMEGEFISALRLPEKYMGNLVMFTSPNKAFNLGGLKLSYSIIPSEKLRNALRKQYLKNSVTSPNVPGQIAMTTAYNDCGEWLLQCESYIKENLNIFEKSINKDFPEWKLLKMESSYLPWIDVSESGFDMHTIANNMAINAGVVVGIGDDYVADADDFLRFNLGTSAKLIQESMDRMAVEWRRMKSNK
ncbi:MalY/PatB family protein [Companilactobacillus huachuanensis]|uniref:cysteine-S-conjugate beta-lyase n=1 Tax=Companilactobacillus huachuanensis TaxID=2559914 RepID=A0ABW1RLY9_9LACO|nr:aminotransferase class I/II-fold pyridoxal phosphate-dependent enzyme [Companilactobacillus huachuanensis]